MSRFFGIQNPAFLKVIDETGVSQQEPENSAPVATPQSITTAEDTAVNITLGGTDADSDPLTYTVVANPSNGVLSGTAPNLTYTPNANYNGPDSFTFRVNDGTVDSANATITITVTAVNDAPVANTQSISTPEDTAVNITLTGSDVDGNDLTYTVLANPTNGILTGTAPNLTYTPNSNYNGPDSFTFRVNDGYVNSTAATINITVTAVNDAPVADAQSVSTAEDTAVAITLTGSDADGNPLTYTVVANPSNGSLSGVAPNLTYTPNANYNGPDSFTFRVNDGYVNSSTATVSITVTAVNDAPVANAQSVTTAEDTAVAITLTGTDVDGNPLTYTVVTNPSNGALTGTAPNLTYTPSTNYNGPDSFAFRVNDGYVDSSTATVSITVTAVNDSPVANAQTVTAYQDLAASITLTGSDIENSPLTYTVVSNPANGTLSGTAPNLTYTPNADYFGTDSFTFRVNDGTANSAPATVTINIQATTLYNLNRYVTQYGAQTTTGEQTATGGLWFRPDGTQVFYLGNTVLLRSFDLTTAWDITTATNNRAASTALQNDSSARGRGMAFQDDGYALFVAYPVANKVRKFSLSTAWDVTTINVTPTQELDLAPSTFTDPRSLYLDPTNTFLTLGFYTSGRVCTYSMSTPGSLATATLLDTFIVTEPQAVSFTDSGNKLVVARNIGVLEDSHIMFSVTSPYRATGVAELYRGQIATGGNTSGYNYYWRTNGKAFYYADINGDEIRQHNVTPGPSPTNRVTAFSVLGATLSTGTETTPQDLYFKPDGSIVYMAGSQRDRVRSYALATPWNLSTAGTAAEPSAALLSADGTTALTTPSGVHISNDGTLMLVTDRIHATNGALFKYILHTPWDITTAGTSSGNRVASQVTTAITTSGGVNFFNTESVRFKSDGSQCIIVNASSAAPRHIAVWNLSTPWDLSTITLANRSVDMGAIGMSGVHISDDGYRLWVQTASTNDYTYYYELATPWDVSGITGSNYTERRLMSPDTNPLGIYVVEGGATAFIIGAAGDSIRTFKNEL